MTFLLSLAYTAGLLLGSPAATNPPDTLAPPHLRPLGHAPRPGRAPWYSSFALGPAIPLGAVRTHATAGIDFTTVLEHSFTRPRWLWLRLTLDATQFNTTQPLAGPGYAYELRTNSLATSLVADLGVRHTWGRFTPVVFVGGGASYVTASAAVDQRTGATVGQGSHLTYALRAGVGVEYHLLKTRLIPYTELTLLGLPGHRVSGQPLWLALPLLGIKLPL